MAQRTSNLYRLVTLPQVYSGFQSALGASSAKKRFLDDIVRATPGMAVLDVGCGPASLFPHLPAVDYTGIDLNPKCIARAQMLYGDRGRFLVGDAARDLPSSGASFDLIIVSAILHHLDDLEARRLFKALVDLVKPDGRIVTIDNVWLPRQNPIAKLVNALDSGMNVRTPDQYIRLLEDLPMRVEPRIYRDLLRIPYDHFCMTLTRATSDDARGEHP